MSVFDHPAIQIWDNAVFQSGEDSSAFVKESWSPSFSPTMTKLSDSLRSNNSFKENLNPNPELVSSGEGIELKSERNIDEEIKEIEREIERLSKKLKALCLKKAERKNGKVAEKERPRERIVPAKFMEQKVLRNENTPAKKREGLTVTSAKAQLNRRGVSLCPTEIHLTAIKSRLLVNKPDVGSVTPGLPLRSRRKSCFWKLDEVDELKVTKERRKSMMPMSLSPNAGKIVPKVQIQKQALTTVGSKKGVKKEVSVISSIQPKRLFKDAEKEKKRDKDSLVTSQMKFVKPGRMVASRYNKLTETAARKRSFPENEKEEARWVDKRRNSNVAGKVKKRWEIHPGDVVVYQSGEEEKEGGEDQEESDNTAKPLSIIARAGEGLRKIRVSRGMVEGSPRDSGPAKRVAELERRGRHGRYFMGNEEGEDFERVSGQALSFIEDAEEE